MSLLGGTLTVPPLSLLRPSYVSPHLLTVFAAPCLGLPAVQWVCTPSSWWDCEASRIWPTDCTYTSYLNGTAVLTCPRVSGRGGESHSLLDNTGRDKGMENTGTSGSRAREAWAPVRAGWYAVTPGVVWAAHCPAATVRQKALTPHGRCIPCIGLAVRQSFHPNPYLHTYRASPL
mgnify:CR=1 FL=1